MINLRHYQGDSFEFYSDVLSRKRDEELQNRLDEIRDEISNLFDEYYHLFQANNLVEVENSSFTTQQKADLLKLYVSVRANHTY